MGDKQSLASDASGAVAQQKRKGVKRRAVLIGGAAFAGAGMFGLWMGERSAAKRAIALTAQKGAGSFAGWLRIAADNGVTLFTPHIDMGTGSSTALAQMVAEELDLDWSQLKVESAPAETAFANVALGRGFLADISGAPGLINATPDSALGFIVRSMPLQITGGSSAIRFTGQLAFRTLAAATRGALIEEAAGRLAVPPAELTTRAGQILHTKTGKSITYGALAEAAAARTLSSNPVLRKPGSFVHIGKPVPRMDIPAKVDGSAQFGIDFMLPDMRVATIMAAPVRGGKLISVDPAPAMAVKGVEKVVKLENAVAVVAKGYWAAINGLRALSPKFSDEGKGNISSASLFAEQAALQQDKGTAATSKAVEAAYRTPFLHHAMMETFALTAHLQDGKLDVWGGLQDPLASKSQAADAAGLSMEDVTFHPMLLGGGFGRKLPMTIEIIPQLIAIAKDVPYPVKLIWSREEEVQQGAYRPLTSTLMKASLGPDGKIASWQSHCTQPGNQPGGGHFFYVIPELDRKIIGHESHVQTGSWRSVEASQHGFYNESFMDELAFAAGVDPLEFRLRHLTPDSRAANVLKAAAKAADWGSPLPKGTGRGIAVVECFGTLCAHVVQASVKADGYPKVEKVWSAVDCGLVVNPRNAEAQVMGGIVMGLSAAIHEEITIEKGAVRQSSFPDYPLLTLAETPEISIEFVQSNAPMGGLGEPGLPPVAPALANALFAASGKRIRQLPIKTQAGPRAI